MFALKSRKNIKGALEFQIGPLVICNLVYLNFHLKCGILFQEKFKSINNNNTLNNNNIINNNSISVAPLNPQQLQPAQAANPMLSPQTPAAVFTFQSPLNLQVSQKAPILPPSSPPPPPPPPNEPAVYPGFH